MTRNQTLVLGSVAAQAAGQVLYASTLGATPPAEFLLVGCGTVVSACLLLRGNADLKSGGSAIMQANAWTAISFLSVFFALSVLPPSVYAVLQAGASLVAAALLQMRQERACPPVRRLAVCLAAAAVCAVMVSDDLAALARHGPVVWAAIGASVLTGVSSTLTARACRELALRGWSPTAVLGHRYYLTLLAAFAWLWLQPAARPPTPIGLATMAAISAIWLLGPLLIQQFALRDMDASSFMICLSLGPIGTVLIQALSPRLGLQPVEAVGALIVTALVLFDVRGQARPPGERPDRKRWKVDAEAAESPARAAAS